MKSAMRGNNTSAIEVTDVSAEGFWIRLDDEKFFVAFAEFPWFRGASVAQIRRIELPSRHHLRWPDLDIDLAVDSIRHPESYPLVSKTR